MNLRHRRFTKRQTLLSYKGPQCHAICMELNPYAKFLGDRDPLEVIASTPAELNSLLERVPDQQIELSAPGAKWTAREIVAHLADCELVFSFRLRQALAEDHPMIQPFDQEKWAARYSNLDIDAAL